MKNLTENISRYVMYALLLISVIFILACATNDNISAMADGSATEMCINWTIAVFVIGIIAAVVAWVVDAFSDKKQLVKTGIAVAAAIVLLLILWACADGTPLNLIGYEGTENVPFWLKVADTGIFTCYIALIGAIGAIVVSEVLAFIK